jgi:aspartyl-tRNA(Asn)/glutamyl-tRNA(Gln) amidotransferase subunit C
MALSEDDVLHIARLARIALTDAEVTRLSSQLSGILDQFTVLDRAPTEGVEATAHPLPLSNVMRADEVASSLPRSAVLSNAPQQEDGLFRVRAVLE